MSESLDWKTATNKQKMVFYVYTVIAIIVAGLTLGSSVLMGVILFMAGAYREKIVQRFNE